LARAVERRWRSSHQERITDLIRPETLRFLEALANSPSPSGFEQPAAQIYRAYTERFADEVRTDVTGNVIAVVNPNAPVRIMLAGHIDEIGFLVHHIGEDGLLHFSGIGGHDDVTAVGQRVWGTREEAHLGSCRKPRLPPPERRREGEEA
jgi:endoglucanase